MFSESAWHSAGDFFTAIFRSSAMNAYYIQDRLEAQSWARHYQQIAREEKEAELADDMEKGLPQHLFESLCIDHLQRHGPAKSHYPCVDDDVSFRSAWQNTSGTWLKPLLHTRLILIQRYKR
ncbi:gam, partial [Escherichia coli FVEC1302]